MQISNQLDLVQHYVKNIYIKLMIILIQCGRLIKEKTFQFTSETFKPYIIF